LKILNLFAGIGGNRTLWGNKHKITAIEYNQKIALIYHKRFPKDKIIITDAYEYFINHFHEFDIVWASPPYKSHTTLVYGIVGNRYNGKNFKCNLPDLRLYSLILFLKHQFRGIWIVENTKAYYKPLIQPTTTIGRHWIWSNIAIPQKKKETSQGFLSREEYDKYIDKALDVKMIPPEIYDILLEFNIMDRKQIINNCVLPKEGKYILDSILNKKQKTLIECL